MRTIIISNKKGDYFSLIFKERLSDTEESRVRELFQEALRNKYLMKRVTKELGHIFFPTFQTNDDKMVIVAIDEWDGLSIECKDKTILEILQSDLEELSI